MKEAIARSKTQQCAQVFFYFILVNQKATELNMNDNTLDGYSRVLNMNDDTLEGYSRVLNMNDDTLEG